MEKLKSEVEYNNDRLYLDDNRSPDAAYGFTVVRNYDEFVKYIVENGLPTVISFDHDLADEHITLFHERKGGSSLINYNDPEIKFKEKTGYDCLKWLVGFCEENKLDLTKVRIFIHSANVGGSMNMRDYINSYYRVVKKSTNAAEITKWKHTWVEKN